MKLNYFKCSFTIVTSEQYMSQFICNVRHIELIRFKRNSMLAHNAIEKKQQPNVKKPIVIFWRFSRNVYNGVLKAPKTLNENRRWMGHIGLSCKLVDLWKMVISCLLKTSQFKTGQSADSKACTCLLFLHLVQYSFNFN